MKTLLTLINDVAQFVTDFNVLEFLTLSNTKMSNLTNAHEISEIFVYDNISTQDLEDFNKNYDKILKRIKIVIIKNCEGF